ncbi:BirA family biotin operon repressor/biotin-[acetyl-CoA-carboxylase] ligase [Bifidobacterium commune]|uniref:BirA family transcriptional regulator, biotin operon repressor / biotin-[acetyl-CoA-carboxylase] ligase n=2 Tax=Bifidobacterium commune TaxID=1505727 RepID=A0A1C4GZ64_9BIFI|nr:BirA family biotin operon repressor/biotin-[acetyl-CoA-carboxylase] ligase [Bifidobacterium commune]SCC77944.1 BirA family transcriptional regulator, biotin operon repressor / biotin-[acetyl-CoA-carboxylase] ligase [Bifidobacterium commune]
MTMIQRIRDTETQYASFARQVGAVVPELSRTKATADETIALAAVDSTNILARTLLATGELQVVGANGCARMAAICADAQTAGHGRLGRQWSAWPEGASFLVTYVTALPRRLVTDPACNGWFTIAAGLASLDALNSVLAQCGAKPLDGAHQLALKWPNDIFCNGRKLGGILAEVVELPHDGNGMVVASGVSGVSVDPDGRSAAPYAVDHVLLGDEGSSAATLSESIRDCALGVMFGIGINLDIAPEHLPTPISTSLQLLYGPLPDPPTMRDMIAAKLTESLRSRLAILVDGGQEAFEDLRDETGAVCWTLGQQVEVRSTDGSSVRGEALSLNADASLTVRDESGISHVVRTGDVGVLA